MGGVVLTVICGDAQREVLPRMAESVLRYPFPLADKVLVGWNGGGDPPTLEGAVEVIAQTWHGDFARARNEVLSAVPQGCEWMWWLDCDDIVAPHGAPAPWGSALASPIHEYLDGIDDDIMSVWLPYRYAEGDKHPLLIPRFIRHPSQWKWVGDVHEELQCQGGGDPIWTTHHALVILHAPVQTERVREDRNIEIMQRMIAEGRGTCAVLYHMARAHDAAGRHGEGVAWYRRALAAARGRDGHRAWGIAAHGVLCAIRAGDAACALVLAGTLPAQRPDLPESYYAGCLAAAAQGGLWGRVVRLWETGQRIALYGQRPMRLAWIDEIIDTPYLRHVVGIAYSQVGRWDQVVHVLGAVPIEERDRATQDLLNEAKFQVGSTL